MKRALRLLCHIGFHWFRDDSEREYHWLTCEHCGKTISYPRAER